MPCELFFHLLSFELFPVSVGLSVSLHLSKYMFDIFEASVNMHKDLSVLVDFSLSENCISLI